MRLRFLQTKRNFFSRFLIVALVAFGMAQSAFSESTKTTKIRVGFFEFDGYHQIAADGTKFGYGYDFLQMIAPYANFEYEYVGYEKSWGEMQKMLENGEIDLLTSAQKTPDREKKFDFSDRSIGFSSTIVTTTPANSYLMTSGFSAYENLKIGMIRNNSRNKSFDNYAKKHGFNYKPMFFEDQIIMGKALREGKIDAMVTSDLRTLNKEIVLAKFDDSPFYAMVKHGNKKLLDKVNAAIEILSADSPSWVHSLSYKYYNNTYRGNEIVLTPEEKEYLDTLKKNHEKLKVLINPDRAPYTYFEKKKPKGMFVDLFEDIAGKIGLEYEVIECKTVKEYENYIRSDRANIVFGCVMDYFTAEGKNYHMTNPFHNMALSCVTRFNETKNRKKVAVNEGMSILNKRYDALYGNREQVKCKTIKECMDAVRTGKADCCYVYTYTAAKYVFEDGKGSLAYSPVSDSMTDVGIAVRDLDGPILFHLMNRISGNFTEDEIQISVANNTNFGYDGNIVTFLIYKRPIVFLTIVVFVLFVVFGSMFHSVEKANRAKTDFLSKMSHDIRTPMNAIVGMTAIAQTHVEEPKKVSDCLEKILSSSHHLLGLINDVLDMSKIESETLSISTEEFNISKLLSELEGIVSPEVEAHKHIFKIYDEIVHKNVVGDSLRIQQVFVNLVGNAIKYTPDGGKIEVFAKELDPKQEKYSSYEFIFKDTGIGMSKEFLKTVFKPFVREKDSRVDKIQGTGLGLAITKNLVTMMGGTITVESEQNKGSTFRVVLKLEHTDLGVDFEEDTGHIHFSEKEELPLDMVKSLNFSGKRILLVDDNVMNREIAKEILEMTKVQVIEAENGRVAIERFAKSSENFFDLIFMDVQMPVMNGYEATVGIRSLDREDSKTVPIIAMTADAFTDDVKKALDRGMNEHLAKPLDIKKLVLVLKKYL